MALGVCELPWLRNLLRDLGIKSAMKLYCDNTSAIEIAHNSVQHGRTKHVEVDRHFIKETLVAQVITLSSVKCQDQLADMPTKVVSGRSLLTPYAS